MSTGTPAQVQYLDGLCRQLYETTDFAQRSSAERELAEFADSPNCLQQCMMLLEHGNSVYAPLVASNVLIKVISKVGLPMEDRYELRTYLLNYLMNRKGLPNYVVAAMAQLFARLTKLSWFDFEKSREYLFRTPVEDMAKLAQESLERCSLVVQLLWQLVAEMNTSVAFSSVTKHRKVASSFRDVMLFDIFQLAVSMLRSALETMKPSGEEQLSVYGGLLQLALNCLSFDFIGSVLDDTSDDNANVQVPTVWRTVLIDTEIVDLFFQLYDMLPGDGAAKSLGCLVQLASVRRTVFNNAERQTFLNKMCGGVKTILDSPDKLSDQAVFHEFCRLVARLKANYQLSELIKVDDYPKLVRLLAEFTVQSLRMYQFSVNSTYYLLSFWQRMVSSMPYVRASEPHLLEQHAPLVTTAFIESRLQLADAVVSNGFEDPLDDHGAVIQQMEQISVIGRCEYQSTCQLLIQHFDADTNGLESFLASGDSKGALKARKRLTWLVMCIGAAVGGRVAFSTSDQHDLIDGDLICRALRLMLASDERLPNEKGDEKLEFAFLYHLEQFRKIYISDQVQKTSKVYAKLSEVLGLNDESAVLAVFVRKIITNLKHWSAHEKLVDDTLTLLNDLSVGYTSVRKLIRLPEIQFLMNNHTGEYFSFLGSSADFRSIKSRTTLYSALTRLLCVDLTDDNNSFENFMLPLTESLQQLCKVFQMDSRSGVVDQVQVKRAVIGLARDLRGVAFACNSKLSYGLLFDWMFPDMFEMLVRAMECWSLDSDVTTPVLKLMCELCQNRSQRLQFEMSSPNAILLFKEAAKLICTYGSRCFETDQSLSQQPSSTSGSDIYKRRYKGIGICFNVLKVALGGCYVNFGVFRLYGDTCLDDVLNIFVKMLLAVPLKDLLAYTKISQNYYYLLESLAQDHMPFLSNLEPHVFLLILRSLHDGLSALDTVVVTGCCSTLDLILSYLYKRISRPDSDKARARAGILPDGNNCLLTVEQNPDVLRQMLSLLLNTVVYEECRCQWSMSRPLICLILLQEDYFTQVKVQIIQSQPVGRQTALDDCFTALMDGIERNLSTKNKDRFTQNLSVFRREANELIKSGTSYSTTHSGCGGGGGQLLVTSATHSGIPNVPSFGDMMTA